jgi:peroxiredoxin Q/BCP
MTRHALVLVLALSSFVACSKPVQRPDGAIGLLPEGAPAPEVVGYDVNHQAVKLSDAKGHAAVVFFYPMDGSPGCTTEVCGFRGAWKQYADAHISVIGISSNSQKQHQEWLEKEKLPFALAADESNELSRAFGVGNSLFGHSRITFLIGPDGKVAHVWPSVDPSIHANDVLAEAKRIAP